MQIIADHRIISIHFQKDRQIDTETLIMLSPLFRLVKAICVFQSYGSHMTEAVCVRTKSW